MSKLSGKGNVFGKTGGYPAAFRHKTKTPVVKASVLTYLKVRLL
ncbi:hypothetical protein [Dyadobacter luticola]|nr:hypothetical protein [Dyadobacter luticola]